MSSNLTTTVENILSLSGSLFGGNPSGGGLFNWGNGTKQVDTFIGAINTAAQASNWDQVIALSNDIMAINGLSAASMQIALNINAAAQKAKGAAAEPGAIPAMVTIVQNSNQQLILAQTSSLHAQLATEGSGIFNALSHIHFLNSQGVLPAA